MLNNVVEPMLYGSSIGVSTVGVIIAAIFWTWLWGPIGLILAMPMTVCLVVMARYVPQLRFHHGAAGRSAAADARRAGLPAAAGVRLQRAAEARAQASQNVVAREFLRRSA